MSYLLTHTLVTLGQESLHCYHICFYTYWTPWEYIAITLCFYTHIHWTPWHRESLYCYHICLHIHWSPLDRKVYIAVSFGLHKHWTPWKSYNVCITITCALLIHPGTWKFKLLLQFALHIHCAPWDRKVYIAITIGFHKINIEHPGTGKFTLPSHLLYIRHTDTGKWHWYHICFTQTLDTLRQESYIALHFVSWECKGSISRFYVKRFIFPPNGSEGHRIWIFQNKNPKISLISPKWYFGNIREILGFLFWKIQILWSFEPLGPIFFFLNRFT